MKLASELDKVKKRGRSIPTFLKKTYEILQDPVNQKVIRWAVDGIGFVVLDEEEFERTVLPAYFKHSNYSSFVRQLNMYNFHKIREVEHQNYFRHELFNRNNISAIEEIKRKPERKKKILEYESDNFSESEQKENSRKRAYIRKKDPSHGISLLTALSHNSHDQNDKIYLEDDGVRSEETTKGVVGKKSQTKTQSEFKIQMDDELSIQNDIKDGKAVEPPRLHTRDLIENGGSAIIFPLQTGLISIYSLASMMK